MYKFWVCLGCDTATLEEIYDEMSRPEDEPIRSRFYPRRDDEHRPLLKGYRQLDSKLWTAYKEVIESYNQGLLLSCGIMMRALLEGICVDQGINDSVVYPLSGKLKRLKGELEERDDLPSKVGEALDGLKSIGDDVAHGLEALSRRELEQFIDFIESLIEFVYRVEYRKMVDNLDKSSRDIAQ